MSFSEEERTRILLERIHDANETLRSHREPPPYDMVVGIFKMIVAEAKSHPLWPVKEVTKKAAAVPKHNPFPQAPEEEEVKRG